MSRRRQALRKGMVVELWDGADTMHNGRRGSKRQPAPACFKPGARAKVVDIEPGRDSRWIIEFVDDPLKTHFIVARSAVLTPLDRERGFR